VETQAWRGRTAKYTRRGSGGGGAAAAEGGGGVALSPGKGSAAKDKRKRGAQAAEAGVDGEKEGEEQVEGGGVALKKLQTSKRRLEKTVRDLR